MDYPGLKTTASQRNLETMITQKQHLTATPHPTLDHKSIAGKLWSRGLEATAIASDTGLQCP